MIPLRVTLSYLAAYLVAGYDTTSVTLSYLAYYLAKHPEIQTKLQREVDMAYQVIIESLWIN